MAIDCFGVFSPTALHLYPQPPISNQPQPGDPKHPVFFTTPAAAAANANVACMSWDI